MQRRREQGPHHNVAGLELPPRRLPDPNAGADRVMDLAGPRGADVDLDPHEVSEHRRRVQRNVDGRSLRLAQILHHDKRQSVDDRLN